MATLPVLPRVVIVETPDQSASLNYYALVLADRTMRLVNYFEGEFDLPLAAFWRLVGEMEAKGYRPDFTPAVERRRYELTAHPDPDRSRWAAELHEGGAPWREVAAIVGYRNANSACAAVSQYRRRNRLACGEP